MIIGTLTLAHQFDNAYWKVANPVKELRDEGFSADGKRDDGVTLYMRAVGRKAGSPRSIAASRRQIPGWGPQTVALSTSRLPPSGLPIGTDSGYSVTRTGMTLFVISMDEELSGTLMEKLGKSERGFETVAGRDRSPDVPRLERLARHGIASFAIRRFTAAATVSVNGKSIRRLKSERTGQHSVDIDDWAVANGFAETHDAKILSSLYRKGSRKIRVVLAAGKV